MCADGKTNVAVAAELGTTRAAIGKRRNRFVTARFAGLSDEPRPGVPRTITDAQIEEVVVWTLEEAPEGTTHWSKRELARQAGLSPATIHRIWRAFGLKPLDRGVFCSIDELTCALEQWIKFWNENAMPFKWTKTSLPRPTHDIPAVRGRLTPPPPYRALNDTFGRCGRHAAGTADGLTRAEAPC